MLLCSLYDSGTTLTVKGMLTFRSCQAATNAHCNGLIAAVQHVSTPQGLRSVLAVYIHHESAQLLEDSQGGAVAIDGAPAERQVLFHLLLSDKPSSFRCTASCLVKRLTGRLLAAYLLRTEPALPFT